MRSVALSGQSVSAVLERSFRRQEKSVASCVGAMDSLSKAFDRHRWERELLQDLCMTSLPADCSARLSSAIVEETRRLLRSVYRYPDKVCRLFTVHVIYADLCARAEDLALTTEPSVTGTDGKHMLYKLSDISGRLLYIGITSRGPTRLVEHYRHKEWFPLVARIQLERYMTRGEVEAREREAIKSLEPIFNIQHNRRMRSGVPTVTG